MFGSDLQERYLDSRGELLKRGIYSLEKHLYFLKEGKGYPWAALELSGWNQSEIAVWTYKVSSTESDKNKLDRRIIYAGDLIKIINSDEEVIRMLRSRAQFFEDMCKDKPFSLPHHLFQ